VKNSDIPKEQIEERAYQLFLECGCDGGHDIEHWLAAEKELQQERADPGTLVRGKSRSVAAG
jgi:hypothetical protein